MTVDERSLAVMLVPAAAVIAAGVIGAVWTLSASWRSAVQHLAAGVVFAAISTEIVPTVMHAGQPSVAIGGFALGVAGMFAMRSLAERLEVQDPAGSALPIGFIVAVSIDCIIDGVVIGTGFAAGARQGVLVAAALALEMFFLGLTTADTVRSGRFGTGTVLAICCGLAAILAAAAIVGFTLLAGAPASIVTALLSFGSAALLYLVTEELLVRAHEHGETRLATSLFFLGFLIVFAADLFA